MKAIRKLDGKIIDVEVHGWNNSGNPISYHTDFKYFYKPEDLDFNVPQESIEQSSGEQVKHFDWQSFRAEAAKDILCALVADGSISITKQEVAESIGLADELIRQLKETKRI